MSSIVARGIACITLAAIVGLLAGGCSQQAATVDEASAPPQSPASPGAPASPGPPGSPAAPNAAGAPGSPAGPSSPALTHDAEESRRICQRNIQRLAMAVLMYAQDYEEVFPPADTWMDVTSIYLPADDYLKCPVDSHAHSYAFNRAVSKLAMARINRPGDTVLVFESTAGRRNAADSGASWPRAGRHGGGNHCAYADGHVKLLRDKPDFSLK